MQLPLTVTFTDSDLPDVIFEATKESLADDAIRAACEEWGIDSNRHILSLSFKGDILQRDCNLLSVGVDAHSLLVVSSNGRLFGKDDLTDEATLRATQEVTKVYQIHSVLNLESSTFAKLGVLKADASMIPQDLTCDFTNLSFYNTSLAICSVGNGFLKGSTTLRSVAFPGLRQVRCIGDQFLFRCEQLTKMDITSATNILTIGKDFLRGCKALSELHLPPSCDVQVVEDDFLHDCASLTTVNLSMLNKATSIAPSFLMGCSSLSTLELSCYAKTIGHSFLRDCISLTTAKLSFSDVEVIGDSFLMGCTSLSTLTLTPKSVHTIGQSFLRDCTSLTKLSTTTILGVIDIGGSFLRSCTSLTSVDFRTLRSASLIGDSFLRGCVSIKKISLELPCIIRIGNSFLRDCTSLEAANIWARGQQYCKRYLIIDGTFVPENVIWGSFLMGCSSLSNLRLELVSIQFYDGPCKKGLTFSDTIKGLVSLSKLQLSENLWGYIHGKELHILAVTGLSEARETASKVKRMAQSVLVNLQELESEISTLRNMLSK